MSPFPRKSEEERAAAKAERERRTEQLRAAEAEAVAIEAQRRAQWHALETSLVGQLPKWEYKVLTSTALAGFGDGKVDGLEALLNHHAAQGWRVVSISFTGQISQAFATDKNHLYAVLERPAVGGGHAGAPVQRTAE